MASADIYAAADDLILKLRGAGADDLADELAGAIDHGSTGTEIALALRWVVRRLIATDQITAEIRSLAVSLESELDRILAV